MPKRKAIDKAQPAFDLKAAREARSLTQIAAAQLLCTNQSSISRWEAEGNTPAIYRMAWDLHWRVDELTSAKKGRHAKRAQS